jgi:hypothetical protein
MLRHLTSWSDTMPAAGQGSREGGYVWIIDDEGQRHAVRPSAISVLSDADPACDATVVQVGSSRLLRVPVSLDEVVSWFHVGAGPGR